MAIGIRCLILLLFFPLFLRAEALDPTVHLRGVVMPAQQVKVSFARSGLVSELADDGSVVRVGEVIAGIDKGRARAELNKSRAMVSSARAELGAAEHSRDKAARLAPVLQRWYRD